MHEALALACGQEPIITVPITVELGESLGVFDVKAGKTKQLCGKITFTGSMQVGSGSIALDPSKVTVAVNNGAVNGQGAAKTIT